MVATALVELRGIRKRYGWAGPWVLCGIDLSVEADAIVEVAGANGARKSTLLRVLAGATLPSFGRRTVLSALTIGYVPERLTPPPFSAADYLRSGRVQRSSRTLVAASRPSLTLQDGELHERPITGPPADADRRRIAVDSDGSDQELVRLIAAGWHVVEVCRTDVKVSGT